MRQELSNCLKAFYALVQGSQGITPTSSEVALHLGKSPSSGSYIRRLLRELEDTGHVTIRAGKHRSVEITQKGRDYLEGKY